MKCSLVAPEDMIIEEALRQAQHLKIELFVNRSSSRYFITSKLCASTLCKVSLEGEVTYLGST